MARPFAEIAALAVLGCGGGSSSPLPPPATQIEPGAAPIIEQWATAMGGRDKLAKLESVHRTGTITRNGLVGRFEKWTTARGYRVDTWFDGFSDTSVFDGAHAWYRDRVGDVRELDGIEIDSDRAAMYWGRYAAIFPDRMAGEVHANPDGTLVMAPRDCRRPLTVAFDPATHLPRSVSQPQHAEIATSIYGDYRDVDGIRLAFTEHITVGDLAQADLVTTAIDHALPDLSRPTERTPPRLDTPMVVPFQPLRDGVPLVRVTINGKPFEFAIGSAAYSSIHEPRRKLIAPDAPGNYEVPHLTLGIGDLTLRDYVLDTRPFNHVERFFGRGVDGALGYDVLSMFVVEIDPIAKTVTFHDRDSYRHAGTGVPITLEHGTPWIDATLEVPNKPPATGRFALDTACACDVMVRAPFAQEHDLLVGLDAKAATVPPERGMGATITAIRFGDQRIEHPQAVFGMPHFGSLEDPESAGIIGMRVIGRYRIVLDYRHKRVWLDPPVSAGTD